MPGDQIDWPEYRLFAEREFERMARILENQQTRIEVSERRMDLADNNRKWTAAIYGFAAGAVPVLVKIILEMLHK